MGKRALKNLKNLGVFAIGMTRRTHNIKVSKGTAGRKENAKNKENHIPETHEIPPERGDTREISNNTQSNACVQLDIDVNTHPLNYSRRYSRRSRQFTDAYHCSLDGKQAAWANKKYRGHCVLPDTIMEEMEKDNI